MSSGTMENDSSTTLQGNFDLARILILCISKAGPGSDLVFDGLTLLSGLFVLLLTGTFAVM